MTNHTSSPTQEQYFTAHPQSDDKPFELSVQLRGYDVTVRSSTGVFSSHRLDLGTSVLLKRVPELPAQGTFLDIGCGWGPLSLAMALESPQADIWALDVNERALALTQHNAQSLGLEHIHASTAEQIPEELTFDVIWSNPPIRVGNDVLHNLLITWLPRLTIGGVAYLVVQKHLGSDSLATWLQTTLGESYLVRKFASSKGYRILEIQHLH